MKRYSSLEKHECDDLAVMRLKSELYAVQKERDVALKDFAKYKKAVVDKLHFKMKAVVWDTPENLMKRYCERLATIIEKQLWRHENPNDAFEERAEAFYRATGIMAPGKSVPLGWNHYPDEERDRAWRKWCSDRNVEQVAEWRQVLKEKP